MPQTERAGRTRAAAQRTDTIQIRATPETKALLTRAASLRGQRLSEFMLDSARRRAEETVLDQRAFFLDATGYDRFVALLDAPPTVDQTARRRLTRRPLWER
ncbi:MAG: DUF1778 domain-containing protein [Alphaproteobacteria bacterium]